MKKGEVLLFCYFKHIHNFQLLTALENGIFLLCDVYKLFKITRWKLESVSNGVDMLEVVLAAIEVEITQHHECEDIIDTYAHKKVRRKALSA